MGVGGATPSGSGSGITFPATQSASTDANTLDDYEEGAWTPTISATSPGTLSVSYSVQVGWYTKIGRQITAGFYITFTLTKGTASGDILISSFPFTASYTGANDAQSGWLGFVSSAPFPVSVCGILQQANTAATYIGLVNGGTAGIASFASGTVYGVRGTYSFIV
jgi:hypothetical protein